MCLFDMAQVSHCKYLNHHYDHWLPLVNFPFSVLYNSNNYWTMALPSICYLSFMGNLQLLTYCWEWLLRRKGWKVIFWEVSCVMIPTSRKVRCQLQDKLTERRAKHSEWNKIHEIHETKKKTQWLFTQRLLLS